MTPVRPDDASGVEFRRLLVALRGLYPAQQQRRISFENLAIEWDHKIMEPGCAAVRDARGSLCAYSLYVVEMRDSFLAGQPPMMPKISWCVAEPGEEPEVGGCAPTYEDAMGRAELVARLRLGIAGDG